VINVTRSLGLGMAGAAVVEVVILIVVALSIVVEVMVVVLLPRTGLMCCSTVISGRWILNGLAGDGLA